VLGWGLVLQFAQFLSGLGILASGGCGVMELLDWNGVAEKYTIP
jgi:hypothetical protein